MAGRRAKFEDLNEKQQAWVQEYIQRGGSRTAATDAVEAVYGYDRRSACSVANRMLKNERIRDVLQELTLASFAPLAVVANERLAEVLTTGMWFGQAVKPSEGLRAIVEALNRGIGVIASRHEVEVTDNRSIGEIKQAVFEKLQLLSETDRALMLAKLKGEAIEAEFETIDPAAPYGRKEDGTARQKPGRKEIEKRVLPGPEAYKPEAKTEIQKIKERIKQRAMSQLKKAQQQENEDVIE